MLEDYLCGLQDPPWVPLLAFVLGGALFLGLGRTIGYVHGRLGGRQDANGALSIFGGVSLDLFSDGIPIGTGTVLNPGLGLLLALGQVPADVPEGFAAVASLRNGRRQPRPPAVAVGRVRSACPAGGDAGLLRPAGRP